MKDKITEFYTFNPNKKDFKTIEKIEKKQLRKTIKNERVLEKGCVAYKTSDTVMYQFSVERINDKLKIALKDLNELEEYIQNLDENEIAILINIENGYFDQKIEQILQN